MQSCKECFYYVVCRSSGTCFWENVEQIEGDCCKLFVNKADVVEISCRCKDCKFYEPYDKPVEDFDGYCIARDCETDETDFCNYGERSDNDAE